MFIQGCWTQDHHAERGTITFLASTRCIIQPYSQGCRGLSRASLPNQPSTALMCTDPTRGCGLRPAVLYKEGSTTRSHPQPSTDSKDKPMPALSPGATSLMWKAAEICCSRRKPGGKHPALASCSPPHPPWFGEKRGAPMSTECCRNPCWPPCSLHPPSRNDLQMFWEGMQQCSNPLCNKPKIFILCQECQMHCGCKHSQSPSTAQLLAAFSGSRAASHGSCCPEDQ